MPKSIPLIALLTLLVSGITAQPVLEMDDFQPVLNQEFFLNNADYIDPGSGGENQTWDFSLANNIISLPATYISPDALAFSLEYPAATHALDNGLGFRLVFNTNSNGMEVLGQDNDFFPIIYDNTEVYLTFPLNYGDSGSDTFFGVWNVGFEIEREGDITYTYDGYGTLIMPYGTVENVARLVQNEFYTDVSMISSDTYESINHVFIQQNTGKPVLQTFTLTVNGTVDSQGIQYPDPEVAGIEYQPSWSYSIYPNPCTERLSVEGKFSGNPLIRILDLNGKIVRDYQEMQLGNGQIILDVSDLAAGMYCLNIQDAQVYGTLKFQVQ